MTAKPLDRILSASRESVRKSGMLTETTRMGLVSAVGTDGTITVSAGDSTYPKVRLLSGYGAPAVNDRVEISNTAGGWVCLGKLVTANPNTWTALSLNTNWAPFSGYAVPAYKIFPDGSVRLRGFADWVGAANTTASQAISTMPVGVRPSVNYRVAVQTSALNFGALDVLPSGVVQIINYTGSLNWAGLSGMIFYLD